MSRIVTTATPTPHHLRHQPSRRKSRRNNAMPELPAIAVFSDGCGLCKDAVSIMRAAGSNAAHVEELGIRATPSIVFNDMVGFVGVPNEEEAELLLKRAEIDRVILQYSIPKSDAVQGLRQRARTERGHGQGARQRVL